MMLIAQLTDLHLGFEPGNPDELNLQRLRTALAWLKSLTLVPEMLFITGDLTDRGDVGSYERLKVELEGLPFPVHLCAGNHDDRAAMRHVFPHIPTAGGHIEYVVDTADMRFIVIDTTAPGAHGGVFGADRAARLRKRLAEVPGRPVMIVLHHPPIETGIPWITAAAEEPWVAMLDAAIGDRPDVTMICGHIHRSITTNWRGRMLAVCPSTAPQVALEMAPIDADVPDGRPMISAEAPGAALHLWTGHGFVTHHVPITDHMILARYTHQLQPMVREMLGESDVPLPRRAVR